ncbi:MAG TPA: glycosyltransferase family 4 protein [Terriglobales bacterium]|nr:glycosyltransferase family 4 protein [Terriglobales bacterium]
MDNRSQPGPLRVLILLEGANVSGPARNVLEFCEVSRRSDAAPAITLAGFVRSSGPKAGINRLFAAARELGLEMEPIHERFPFDLRVLPALRDLVKKIQPHIIETHHVKSHFLVRLSGVWRSCSWIAFHHGYTRDARRTLVYNQLDRWSLRLPSQIITVCEPFAQQLRDIGVPPSRISVVYNAIAEDWINAVPQNHAELPAACAETGKGDGDRTILAVGRLSREKAFTDLVAAVGQLRDLTPSTRIRLIIAGDGPEKSRIEERARSLRLLENVTLPGHVHDVRPYYRAADVLAISSTSEGSPNVLLEALAAGVPTVATAVGGVPEMVEDRKSALLVPPGDPRAMAEALQRLFTDASLRKNITLNGRELIASRYSPQSRARVLMDAYETVVRRQITK